MCRFSVINEIQRKLAPAVKGLKCFGVKVFKYQGILCTTKLFSLLSRYSLACFKSK